MLILPAIDLRAGKCVRLRQGSYDDETVYDNDPSAVAAAFCEQGAKWIHVVDLDGAKSGSPQNFAALSMIVETAPEAQIQFGGGIRDLRTAEQALALGVSRVVVGTQLVRDPDGSAAMIQALGDRLAAGIDARAGMAAVAGWTETTNTSAIDLALRIQEAGVARVIVTDIGRDGMLGGPNLEMLKEMVARLRIPVVASGGASSIADVEALNALGVESVIVGKAIYERLLDLREAIAVAQSPPGP